MSIKISVKYERNVKRKEKSVFVTEKNVSDAIRDIVELL